MKNKLIIAKFRAFIRALAAFIASFIEDILIFSGLGVVIYATFRLCNIAGWYCLGGVMFGLGAWMTVHPRRK